MSKQTWTQEEIEALRRMYPDSSTSKECMEQYFGRLWSAIRMKARRLGLERLREGSWSSEEINDLRRMYPDTHILMEHMVSHFGRSDVAITTMAYELGIRRRQVEGKSWSQDENESLSRLYTDKAITPRELERIFGRSSSAITGHARILGLSRYNHQIKHDYFHEITTDEQAYWLGWLASDGSVRRSTTGGLYIALELQERDEAVVRAFMRAVAPGASIHRARKAVCLRIGSNQMARDLAGYGIVPKKTEIFDWPQTLPEMFAMPFILGYFDGDGCLYKCRMPSRNIWTWYLLGTASFLKVVREHVEVRAQVQLRGPIRADNRRCPFLYKLYTSNKEWIRRIDSTINASGLGLPRKHL